MPMGGVEHGTKPGAPIDKRQAMLRIAR